MEGHPLDPPIRCSDKSPHNEVSFILLSLVALSLTPSMSIRDTQGVSQPCDQATLQATHRRTPAPCGTLAAPAVLPTHSFGDVDPEWMQIFGLCVRCGLVLQ